jgi:hypothetical protein
MIAPGAPVLEFADEMQAWVGRRARTKEKAGACAPASVLQVTGSIRTCS